jgi:hypothetical protein
MSGEFLSRAKITRTTFILFRWVPLGATGAVLESGQAPTKLHRMGAAVPLLWPWWVRKRAFVSSDLVGAV